ncbi:hypothetical protein OHA69_14865 [Streptomyces anulatus]|uniref:hypothetical protein n=1 Tax=Streptomyces anulatus TaxID=1892 RepID=UPI0022556DF1|nr:hypothetical protein [Streptomyces anulatus]MCX4518934.1 hypothetical protein [Streptomyces anulatus]
MSLFIVDKANTSLAWQEACLKLDVPGKPKRDALHTVVHIVNAAAENTQIREEFDQMRKERGYAPIETVANTLFPAELAAVSRTPEELVRRYRSMYSRLRRIDPGNKTGTYFGRIVAYPGEKGPVDQLTALINRIRRQAAGKGPMTAAYEMGVDHPDDRPASDLAGGDHAAYADTGTWSAPVHAAGKDNGLRGFPCLSHCSFQLDRNRVLHAVAHYRSHYMVTRAYGNYLGLGRLLAYLAKHAEVSPGALTVVAGHAQIEGDISALRPILRGQTRLVA